MTDTARPSRMRRLTRLIVRIVCQVVLTAALAIGAFLLGWATWSRSLPDPPGWLNDAPKSEFRARDAKKDGYDFDDYRQQEDRVFKELDVLIKGPWAKEPAATFCRFRGDSVSNPATILDRNWNRTFVLESEQPIGGALLVHGLSDSPYSMRAMGQHLHEQGYTVVGLRVPGHGTCPAALAEVSWHDWTAAVEVAARGVRDMIPADAPLVLGGYSNGGALVTNYAAIAATDPDLPEADAVVLFSPMIGINSMAKLTWLYRTLVWIPAFKKLRWGGIQTEIDPFKYSSWPTNATEQAWAITQAVETQLARLDQDGEISKLPPFLTFQSLVDSTVVANLLIRRLFDRLEPGTGELVLYDVNRIEFLEELLRQTHTDRVQRALDNAGLPYALTVISNAGPDSAEVVARRRDGSTFTETAIGLRWPKDIFSLAHVSLPFPPDDPIVGTREATNVTKLPLGSLDVRGETGVLTISESLLIRLRHNPFYDFQIEHMTDWLEAHALDS